MPLCYSHYARFDQVGFGNLFSRPRFRTAGLNPAPSTLAPLEGPERAIQNILLALPEGFDLPKMIFETFRKLGTVTSTVRNANASTADRLESSTFISRTDAHLCKSIAPRLGPDREGNTSRRYHLTQTFRLLVLIYTTLVASYEGPTTELFLYRFERAFRNELIIWGRLIVSLYRLLLADVAHESEIFTAEINLLIDTSLPMTWAQWRDLKDALLDFFVHNPACHGQLQDLWKQRLG
jgi:hypothetical protein